MNVVGWVFSVITYAATQIPRRPSAGPMSNTVHAPVHVGPLPCPAPRYFGSHLVVHSLFIIHVRIGDG